MWWSFDTPGLGARIDGWLERVRAKGRMGIEAPAAQHDLAPLLAAMRVRKDAGEVATMRRAAQISAAAHVRAMRFCGARFANDPRAVVPEYDRESFGSRWETNAMRIVFSGRGHNLFKQ